MQKLSYKELWCHFSGMNSAEATSYLSIITCYMDAFIPCWNGFQISVTADTSMLYSQLFMNSQFHFFMPAKLASSLECL
jgi:hypothetical protein